MNKETTRSIVSGILSFFMMVSLTLLVILISLALTLFHFNFITNRMDDVYFDSVMNSLKQTLQDDIAPPTGFPDEVFDNLFSRTMVEEDSKASVQAILSNVNYSLDVSRIRQTLMTRFTQYAKDNGLTVSEANLESLANICIDEYERQISVPFLKSFAPIRRLFDHVFTYALLGMAAFLIVVTLFLFYTHPFKHRALRYSIYSLFASALMVIPFPLFLLIQGDYTKVNILPDHVKMLFVSAVRTTLLALVAGGLLMAALGIAFLPLTRYLRNNLLRPSRSEEYD